MAQLIDSTSIWCDIGTSDKVYCIQKVRADNGKYQVDTQYGPREKVISGNWNGRSFKTVDGKDAKTLADSYMSEYEANRLYNDLLSKKVKKGYDKQVPTIFPAEYGDGSAVFVTKEELAKVAESVKGLMDFLSTKGIKQADETDAMAAVLASME